MAQRYRGLSEHIQAAMRRVENKRSAEHSRLAILASAARMANTHHFAELKVPEICRACGISRATFYLHFDGLDALYAELMRQLTALESSLTPDLKGCPDFAEGVGAIVDWYVDIHLANAALFDQLTFLRRSNPGINRPWLERATALHQAVTRELERFVEFHALDRAAAEFVLEFFGAGMNSIVSRISTGHPRNPYLPTELGQLKAAISLMMRHALLQTSRELIAAR